MSSTLRAPSSPADGLPGPPRGLLLRGAPIDRAWELRAELNRHFLARGQPYRVEFLQPAGGDGTLVVVGTGPSLDDRAQAPQELLDLSASLLRGLSSLVKTVLERLNAESPAGLETSTAPAGPLWCDPI